jgi:hypothetical protein
MIGTGLGALKLEQSGRNEGGGDSVRLGKWTVKIA